jgi:predicted dehydrogenase
VKILIAGLGSIGQRHARNLRALLGDELDLLAYRVRGLPDVITERMTVDRSSTVEQRYGIRCFSELAAAFAERPDAVIVCNPTRFHLQTAIAAIHAGAHVLIEKPLSDSMDGVDDLIACAERRRLTAAVGYQLRFHPALLRLKEWLDDRRVGAIVSVKAEWGEYLPDAHPYEDYRQSYAARSDLGGGVILCFIHEFDYLTWLLGTPRTVSAIGGRSGELDVDVEDHAVTSMKVERDGRTIPIELHLSFTRRQPSRTCTITGTDGSIAVDFLEPAIELRAGDGAVHERATFPGFERNQLFVDEMKSFLAALDGGRPAVTAREGAVSLRVALAAKHSLATNRTVDLD